jgi:hypothetical protein
MHDILNDPTYVKIKAIADASRPLSRKIPSHLSRKERETQNAMAGILAKHNYPYRTIWDASKDGDAEAVELLLQQGFSVNIGNPSFVSENTRQQKQLSTHTPI